MYVYIYIYTPPFTTSSEDLTLNPSCNPVLEIENVLKILRRLILVVNDKRTINYLAKLILTSWGACCHAAGWCCAGPGYQLRARNFPEVFFFYKFCICLNIFIQEVRPMELEWDFGEMCRQLAFSRDWRNCVSVVNGIWLIGRPKYLAKPGCHLALILLIQWGLYWKMATSTAWKGIGHYRSARPHFIFRLPPGHLSLAALLGSW